MAKEKLYVFRRYKKKQGAKNVRHPKLIVDSIKDKYGHLGLTSSSKTGHHKNYEMQHNPQKGKTTKSYLRKSLEYDDKELFGEILNDYKLSKEDKEYVIDFVNKHKKKK